MDGLLLIGETSSKTLDLENSILKTDIVITSIDVFSGDNLVSFELFNNGEQKLWKWDDFDLLITYDANTGGPDPVRVTEKFSYNDVGLALTADFNIQRGVFDFGATEDADTVTLGTPVKSIGDGSNVFVRLTNVQHAGAGRTTGDTGNRQNDEIGVLAQLTATDTITFSRKATASNNDQRVAWELWEYIGPPGGPNEFIVRLDTQITTRGPSPVDTEVLNVVNRNNLVPFVTSSFSDDQGTEWHDVTHTAEIVDGGAGITYVRLDRDGAGTAQPSELGIVVVEFTGSNWMIQNNIQHIFTAAGATQTENIPTAVNSWNEVFIVVSYYTNDNDDERNELGHNVWPGATNDQLRFRIRGGADNIGSNDYVAMAHVVENPALTLEHLDSITGGQVDLPDPNSAPEIETRAITAAGDLAQTGLVVTTDTAGGGNGIGRDFWNYRLSLVNQIEFWRADGDGAGDWVAQVIQFPQLNNPLAATLWSVFNIKNDFIDPDILNNQETAQISAQLSNPVFQNGLVIVQIATDRGTEASASKIAS